MSSSPTTAAMLDATIPPARPRLLAIDGVRALAMLMVYTYHVWQFGGAPALAVGSSGIEIGRAIGELPAGVDLFMVLSGFCLFWPLAWSPSAVTNWSWVDYFKRRTRRIVPPYYAAILFATLLPVALLLLYRALGHPAKWQELPSLWQYVTHLLFIHTLFPETWDGIQGAFWSLGLEVQFYLAFPLVVIAFRRYGIWRTVGAMVTVSVAYRMLIGAFVSGQPWPNPFLFSVFFLGRWMQFAAGMAGAWLVAQSSRRGTTLPARTGGLILACAVSVYALAGSRWTDAVPVFPLRDVLLAAAFAAAMVALCATRIPARRVFESRAIVWLGGISYSIFLIHQNTAFYLSELLKKVLHLEGAARFAVLMTIGFACIVAASYVFYRWFEMPFMAAKPPTAAAAPATKVASPAILPTAA